MQVYLFVFAAASLLDQDRALDLKERPVAKVLRLLKDMQGQLMEEKKADEEQYEKIACWCETNRQGKTTATEVATSRVEDLTHRIKALTAKDSSLDTSIKQLTAEVEKNTEALATATELRAKEAAAFHTDETETVTSIESLKAALTVLAKHQSFLQMPQSFVAVQSMIKPIVDNDDLVSQILNGADQKTLDQFVQSGAPQEYASQSSEIYGVLEQMKTNFEKNLSGAQKDELAAKAAFADLKAAKTEEIASGKAQIKDKETILARTREEHAEAKEDLRDTSAALAADQAFLDDLEQRCAAADADWDERSKTRSAEIAAVSEAIKILSEDDAHDTFGRTLGFIQIPDNRAQASAILAKQARKSQSVALAQLAQSAKLDAFTKVQKAIDDMITALTTQQADEVKHKDFCNSEFHETESDTFQTQNAIEDLTTSIERHGSTIDTLTADLAELASEMKDTEVEFQQANENRAAQNKAFQTTIADQRATQVILKKALDRLRKFYDFVQVKQTNAKQEPGAPVAAMPAPLAEFKTNAGSGSVLTMIENVMTDAANMEKEATQSEQKAQAAYEAFVNETNAAIAALSRSIMNKKAEAASTRKAQVQAKADQQDALFKSEHLAQYTGELHKQCDFVLANFDARQTARLQEMDALRAAKAALRTA